LLTKFLALAPGEVDWGDLFHHFASSFHNDLPSVFRRIDAAMAYSIEQGISFFYWAAATEFDRVRGFRNLLPEVGGGGTDEEGVIST
jgi:hypothetical protein